MRVEGFRAPLVLAVALVVAAAPASRAEELRIDLGWDLGLTLGVGGTWILTEVLKGYLAPDVCHWCAGNAFDDGVRAALRWDDTEAANSTSYVLGVALLPALMMGVNAASARDAGTAVQGAEDLLLVLEAVAFASTLNQATKFLVGRQRPFVRARGAEERSSLEGSPDDNLSFFSAHVTLAFAAAVSGATVATLRGYDTAPYLWVVGGLMALGTGYLRIAADRHYLSDVLVGAAVGALVGWAVPWLHRASLWDDEAPDDTDRASFRLGPPVSFGMVF